MQRVKRLFSVLLTCAMLLGMVAAPTSAEAADDDYELVFLDPQKLTAGEEFDPDTAETVTSADEGDIIVLSVAFKNNSSASVRVSKFSFTVNFDSARLSPYSGTAPFAEDPDDADGVASFMSDLPWTIAPNYNNANNGVITVGGMNTTERTVAANGQLVLGRMAFQVKTGAADGVAKFEFDSSPTVGGRSSNHTLAELKAASLTIGDGESPDNPDNPENPDEPYVAGDYELVFLDPQKLTAGEEFDPDKAETISSADEGDIFVLSVAFKNNASDSVRVSKFSFTVNFDSARISPYSGTAPFAEDPDDADGVASFMSDLPWTIAPNYDNANNGVITVGGMNTTERTVAANGQLVLGRMAFQVKTGAANGVAKFDFDSSRTVGGRSNNYDLGSPHYLRLPIGEQEADTAVKVSPTKAEVTVPDSGAADVMATFTAEVKEGGTTVENPTVTWTLDKTITGVSIDAGTVTVTPDAAVTEDTTVTVTAAVGEQSDTATLTIHPNGGGGSSTNLSAKTEDGEKTTAAFPGGSFKVVANQSGVTWTVTDANDNVTTEDITVAANGTVTVGADAAPGTYYIVATGEDAKTDRVTLTVEKPIKALTLSPKSDSVPIPTETETATRAFKASNQDNEDVAASALTWTLSGNVPAGVTIHNGIVTVPKGTTIDGESVVVTVRAAASESVYDTAELTITDSSTPTTVELDHVELDPAGPVAVSEGNAALTVRAYAIDTAERRISSGVIWELTPSTLGVSINADTGVITVPANLASTALVDYEVKATYGSGDPKTATLTLQRPTEYGISIIVNGQTPMETTINIPGVNDADPVESVPFSAIDTQNGEIIRDGITWTLTENDYGMPGPAVSQNYVDYDVQNGVLTLKVYHAAKDWVSGLTGKSLLLTATRTSDSKSASAVIIVRRAEPVFSRVYLSLDEETNTATGGIPISLTVDGVTQQVLNAVAQDQYEEAMQGSFTWKVWTVRADGSRVEQPSNGVTAPASATAEIDVGVSATAKDGTYRVEATQGETTYDATLTVSQQNEEPYSLTVSDGQHEMEIPGKDEDPKSSAAFTALVLDQYGAIMRGAEVTWELFDASGNKVSSDDTDDETAAFRVKDGAVIVGPGAKESVTDTVGRVFTVRASTLKEDGTVISGTAQIRLKRAAPYLKYITLDKKDGQNPVDVTVDGTQDVTVQGEAWDQYETPISATWSLRATGSSSGVTIDSESGLITVSKDASAETYSVSATKDGYSAGPNTLIIHRGTPVPDSIIISGPSSVYIPGDEQTAPNTANYTATVQDQFGAEMTGQYITWSVTDESGAPVPGISIADGVLSVANEVKSVVTASNRKTVIVSASCGSVAPDSMEVNVFRAPAVLSKVQLNSLDSPDASGSIVTFDYSGGDMKIQAAATDQYSSPFGGATWTLSSYNSAGVSINPTTGEITVSNGAVSGVVYTVTATSGGRAASAPFLINNISSASTVLTSVTLEPETVTISASNASGAISQATARDADGQPITRGVTWSLLPASQGVSIDSTTGRITVASTAVTQNYFVTATPNSAFGVSGSAQYAVLKVETPSTPTVRLARVAVQPDAITVNGASGATAQASAYDSDGQSLSGVTWSISPSSGGVSIGEASGAINAFRSATAGIYTITGVKDGVSQSTTLTVRNETPATLSNVTLIPEVVTLNGSSGTTSAATAWDSNNNAITSGVTWSVSPSGQGVTVADGGSIAIAATTPEGNYTVTAFSGSLSASAVLRVNRSSASTVTLSSVSVLPTAVTVNGTAAQTATATARGSDGQTITTGVTWSVSPLEAGVAINATSGVISIAADATGGNYVVTGTYAGVERRATFHVTNTATPSEPEYAVTVTPKSVTVNGTAAQTAQAEAKTSDDVAVTGGIVWSVTPTGNGVSVDATTGAIVIAATAASGTYTVTGSRGEESHSDTLTVTNNTPPALASIALNPALVTLNGQAAASQATAVNSDNAVITAGVTWSVSPDKDGVSIDAVSGAISIDAGALAGTYTVTATYQATTRSAALTVEGGADVRYADSQPEQDAEFTSAQPDIPTYAATGVKSSADQARVKAAALAATDVQQAVADENATTEVIVGMDIKLESYDKATSYLKLSVTPTYEIITNGDTANAKKGTLSELSAPVTVSLNVPSDFDATFAKHTHTNAASSVTTTYYEPISYSVKNGARVANWTQQYFSEVELTKNVVTITFDAAGGTPAPVSQTTDVGGTISLPTVTRPGYTFIGWYREDNTVVSASTTFTKSETLTAAWTTSGGGGGGGGSSSGGGGGGSSSGGSGGSSGVSYTITLSNATGGTLSASAKRATSGTVITVVSTPRTGYVLDTLTVKTRAGKEIDVSSSNGTHTFEMPKASVTVTASFTRSSSSNTDTGNSDTGNTGNTGNNGNSGTTPVNPYPTVTFVDMPSDNFFYTAVQWAVERGITNGTTATTFSPNQACTRAQMVMFLWRSQGMPMPTTNYSPFYDVDPSANYYTAMLWAVERGITNGVTATTFEPYSPCTRAQMVMFLWRVAGRPTPTKTDCPFTDITVGENYYIPMLWALETGITNGTTATTFSPYQACTRAQMVMFLYRYLGGR